MNAVGGDPPGRQIICDVAQERRWSADIKVSVERDAESFQARDCETARRIEVNADSILSAWPAVLNVAPTMGHSPNKVTRLLCERMLHAIASSKEPPDNARRAFGSKRVQHCQN